MPGAPSFIARTGERHRFGHGVLANHQIHKKNVNSPGIMKLPSQAATREDAFHDTFYVSAATGWHKPHARYWLAACSAVRKGGNQQLIYLARSLSRVWRSS